MNLSYQNRKMYGQDELKLVLTLFYSIDVIRSFYQENEELLLENPVRARKKLPVKNQMAGMIAALGDHPERMSAVLQRFPEAVYRLIERLIWEPVVRLDHYEKESGTTVSELNEAAQSYYDLPLRMKPHFEWVVLSRISNDYYSSSSATEKSLFELSLPPAVSAWLKPHFPKIKGYDLEGHAELSADILADCRVFNCADSAVQDCVVVADFIRRGGVQVNQNGKVALTTLRTLEQTTSGGELYPGIKKPQKLQYVRHKFLIEFIQHLKQATLDSLADASIDPKRFLRGVVQRLGAMTLFAGQELLPHMRTNYKYDEPFADESGHLAEFLDLFALAPAGRWVTLDELSRCAGYRELDGVFFDPSRVYFEAIARDDAITYGRYSSRFNLVQKYVPHLVTRPLLSGLALALASLGLVEVVFAEPSNEQWVSKKEDYLSPFEGVRALRLTPLGLFAWGKTDVLPEVELENHEVEIEFHPERLHARCSNIDKITETTLREYLEPIGSNLFRLDRASFLKSCQTKRDVAEHIQQFRQRIPLDLPPLWEAFFERLKNEPAALALKTDLQVFELPEDSEIRQAFSRDHVLAKYVRKVEGWRIAIEKKQLPEVKKRLRALGFFAE